MSYVSEKYGDCRVPTDEERQKLCEMIWRAFIEIRMLARRNKLEQIEVLADAFHNLPSLLYSDEFSKKYFRQFLESYHNKYPKNETGGTFLEMLDKINK